MMVKLLALGLLGYAAYRYVQARGGRTADRIDGSLPQPAVAGGPLSEQAVLQRSPELE
jgi:hypothetical protein